MQIPADRLRGASRVALGGLVQGLRPGRQLEHRGVGEGEDDADAVEDLLFVSVVGGRAGDLLRGVAALEGVAGWAGGLRGRLRRVG